MLCSPVVEVSNVSLLLHPIIYHQNTFPHSALIHSFSVDIYDGPGEPMTYHGNTWTSKVSVREVCEAIAKYAFVSSPYPVLLSAEVHCGLEQQDMLFDIMTETLGDALVRAPVNGRLMIEVLPSPEDPFEGVYTSR